jgi:hypothetical protein
LPILPLLRQLYFGYCIAPYKGNHVLTVFPRAPPSTEVFS